MTATYSFVGAEEKPVWPMKERAGQMMTLHYKWPLQRMRRRGGDVRGHHDDDDVVLAHERMNELCS